jgi:TPR repeat protein
MTIHLAKTVACALLAFILLPVSVIGADSDLGDSKLNLELIIQQAEQGHALAQFNLGLAYDKGEGVIQDYKEAFKWYRRAAEQGHAYAQFNLGVMYGKGEGVTIDYEKSEKWLLKAAEQGHAFAQDHLGYNYQNGKGVIQDFVQAHAWFNVASANGWSDASKDRDLVAKQMTPEQISKAQELAKEYFEKYQAK